jgi:hypothetical protein
MKKIFLAFFVTSVLFTSCTKNFQEIDTDVTRVDPVNTDFNALFGGAVTFGMMRSFEFQRVQALYADLYSGYFGTSINYFPTDRYGYNTTWLDAGWNLFYPREIHNCVNIINSNLTTPEQKAIARIWKVFLFHRYVDFYGDVVYFNAIQRDKPQTFDAQRDIYYDFFKELTEANAILTSSTITAAFNNQDPIYGATAATNVANWRKFGNSLRLRLAIRISKKDPAKAKLEGEAAILNGTFTANAENALARVSSNQPNPLNAIADFNEFRMGAAMESAMLGYADPRLPQYFSVVTNAAAAALKPYNGVAPGLASTAFTGANSAVELSNVGPRFLRINQTTNPIIVLTYAEVCFNKAEAAWLGWNAGTNTATQWYNLGITASMDQFGIGSAAATAYQNNTTNVPMTPDGLSRGISTLPVRFSTVAAEQEEQIAMQKWLATYPDGFEGWSNFRRTGYPKLYPPATLEATSDVPAGQFIQRIPYPDGVKGLSAAETQRAGARMGGDKQFTKLWFAGGN